LRLILTRGIPLTGSCALGGSFAGRTYFYVTLLSFADATRITGFSCSTSTAGVPGDAAGSCAACVGSWFRGLERGGFRPCSCRQYRVGRHALLVGIKCALLCEGLRRFYKGWNLAEKIHGRMILADFDCQKMFISPLNYA